MGRQQADIPGRDLWGSGQKMERWYGVDITIWRIRHSRISNLPGSFKEETIGQALHALRLTASFNYKIEGNQITINK